MLINYTGESKVISRICELINTMTGVNFEVVTTLPTTDISTSTIYLVPKSDPGAENIYDEYINTDGTSAGWELIGDTEIDLSDYYTKTESDNRYVQPSSLATVATSGNYSDLSNTPTIPTDFVPKSTGGTFEGDVRIEESNPAGTTSQQSQIVLGNNKSVGTPNNSRGRVAIYGYNSNFFAFEENQSNQLTGNRTLSPQDKNGTIALVEDFTAEPQPAGQDLNDYKESGVYYFTAGEYPTNTPVGTNGLLVVIKSNWDDSQNRIFVKQIWFRHGTQNSNDYHTYIRTYRTDSNSWSNWHRVITSEGGSITGNITIVVPNSSTTTTNSGINLGNNIPAGTEGTTRGVLNIYGVGSNYAQFVDGVNTSITGNRSLYLPDKNGVIAVSDDLNYTQQNMRSLLYTPFYRSTPYTYREVTFSYTPDGTITANGTATGGNANMHFKVFASNLYIKGGKSYFYNACPSGGADSKYWAELIFGDDNNTSLLTIKDYGNGVNVIAPANATKVSCQIVIKSGYTVENLTFKPILIPVDFPSCDKTSAGTYTLQATVDANGQTSYSWV